MFLNMCTWWFFDDIMTETGLEYKGVYDDFKRDGDKVYMKYRITYGIIDMEQLRQNLKRRNGWILERDFNGGVHAGITKMNAQLKVKEGLVYLTLSFIDTVGKAF